MSLFDCLSQSSTSQFETLATVSLGSKVIFSPVFCCWQTIIQPGDLEQLEHLDNLEQPWLGDPEQLFADRLGLAHRRGEETVGCCCQAQVRKTIMTTKYKKENQFAVFVFGQGKFKSWRNALTIKKSGYCEELGSRRESAYQYQVCSPATAK